jgi:hypothetical protein
MRPGGVHLVAQQTNGDLSCMTCVDVPEGLIGKLERVLEIEHNT